jgi:hypothetical protein
MVLEAAKATLLAVSTPPASLAGVLPDTASPTYVPVSSDWVLPEEANGHVSSASCWFESDLCEVVSDMIVGPAPGQATDPVEALSYQVQDLELALVATLDPGHGGTAALESAQRGLARPASPGDTDDSHLFIDNLFPRMATPTLKSPALQRATARNRPASAELTRRSLRQAATKSSIPVS